jgi:hypothetical protein
MRNSYYIVLQSRGMKVMRVLDGEFLGKYYAMGMGSLELWTRGDLDDMKS